MTLDLHRHFHYDRLAGEYLEEVNVHHCVLHGLELQFLHDSVALLAVEFHLDSEDVGSVDELAHISSVHADVGSDDAALCVYLHELLTRLQCAGEGELNDFAAVEDCGDFAFSAELFHCTLSECFTRLGFQLKCLHY